MESKRYMTDQETKSKNETDCSSRRVFLATGVLACINVPIISLPLKTAQMTQTSFSCSGPFRRGDKYYFDEATRKKLPFFPASIQPGNNDIAIWYYPEKEKHDIRMTVSLDLYDEKSHLLSTQTTTIKVEWSEDACFDGNNIRFRIPRPTLIKAQKITVRFTEFRQTALSK